VLFTSDNGACAEWDPYGFDDNSGPQNTLHRGQDLRTMGQPGSYHSYGSGWANASNTPWRFYKHFDHEGGISTPLVVRWPGVVKPDTLTREVGHVIVHMLIGMVIGAMVSLREADRSSSGGPLVVALSERARRLGDAFRNVVFAQVRISALNTAFTAAYLLVALPIAGIHLPYAKTLVVVTFIAGLLPVVGNLISNTVIVIVSLSQSLTLAVASLAFLVVIHKAEYFLNARIVGARIHAKAWELLVAMLVMEAAFGIAGLVAAPIYYAYLKDELAARKLI